MIKQIVLLCLWNCIAFYAFAVSTTEVPKECTFGTPDYNEKLCSDICTQETHTSKPYCANFTQSQPQQEVHNAVTMPEINLPTNEEAPKGNVEVSTPETNATDVISSGSYLQPSLMFSVLCFIPFFNF